MLTGAFLPLCIVATAYVTGASMIPKCAKCGVNNKNGKRSCCVRGGSWFTKCSETANGKFDYTWTQGIEACAGTSNFRATIRGKWRRLKAFLFVYVSLLSFCDQYVDIVNRSTSCPSMPPVRTEPE